MLRLLCSSCFFFGNFNHRKNQKISNFFKVLIKRLLKFLATLITEKIKKLVFFFKVLIKRLLKFLATLITEKNPIFIFFFCTKKKRAKKK